MKTYCPAGDAKSATLTACHNDKHEELCRK